MGELNNTGYKNVNKVQNLGSDPQIALQDLKDSLEILSSEDIAAMRNPIYQYLI